MNTKNINMQVKSVDEDGTFSGYASTFGNVDLGGDMIVKGAFKKTITERKSNVKMLWNHNQNEIIGVFDEIREDDNGLFVKGRLALKTQRGQEAHELLKMKAVDAMSIGYAVIKDDYDRKNNIRLLKEVKLFEASLVTIPMNQDAVVTNVKSGFDTLSTVDKESVLTLINKLKSLSAEEPLSTSQDNPISVGDVEDATDTKHLDSTEADSQEITKEPLDDEVKHSLVDLIKTLKGK